MTKLNMIKVLSLTLFLATGMIFEIPVMPDKFVPWAAMAMPVGAFLTLGLLLGLANIISKKSS